MTGCRQEELRTLTRRQVDLTRGQITLYRTKSGRARSISLSPAAQVVFRTMLVNMTSPVVFWHGSGKPYENVSSRFRAIVLSAQKSAQDIRPFRFHDLRHRFAVDYLKNGGNLYDLQQHLGHSSVKVTERYLAYLTPDEARSAKHGPGTNVGTYATV